MFGKAGVFSTFKMESFQVGILALYLLCGGTVVNGDPKDPRYRMFANG